MDREYQDLLAAWRKGKSSGGGTDGGSVWRRLVTFMTRPGRADGSLREESLLDPEYGEFSLSLNPRERGTTRRGGDSPGAGHFAETLRALHASVLAAVHESAPARFDSFLVPIYVSQAAVDGSLNAGSDFSPGVWITPNAIANAGTAPILFPSPDWSGLNATPTGGNAAAWNGNSSGNSLIVTGPLSASFSPVWQNFIPTPLPGGRSDVTSHHFSRTSGSLVMAPQITTPPSVPVPPIASQSIQAPMPTGASGATLSSSAPVAPSAQIISHGVQPAPNPIYVADILNDRVDAYNSAAVNSPIVGFSPISSPSPTALAASLTYLYVGDSTNHTVKAYSPTSGTQISPAFFTPISVPSPTALLLSGNGANLFVASASGTVKEYNASTGQINNNFSVSSPDPLSLVLSANGADIYIGDAGPSPFDGTNGTLKEYAVSDGVQVSGTLISGNFYPGGMALSANGADIYIAEEYSNLVKEYTTSGAPTGLTFSPASPEPTNLVLSGNGLYVADQGIPGVIEYNATTGVQISTSTFEVTGVNPDAVAIPEPTSALLLLGSGALLLLRRRRAA